MLLGRISGFAILWIKSSKLGLTRRTIYVAGGVNKTGLLDSIEEFSIADKTWTLLDIKIPHQIEDLSMHSIRAQELLIFGGQNPEIEKQFIYKIDIANKNPFLVSEMMNTTNDKSCLYKNKILSFGVKRANLTKRTRATNARNTAFFRTRLQ